MNAGTDKLPSDAFRRCPDANDFSDWFAGEIQWENAYDTSRYSLQVDGMDCHGSLHLHDDPVSFHFNGQDEACKATENNQNPETRQAGKDSQDTENQSSR
jgi:hypothetical protein